MCEHCFAGAEEAFEMVRSGAYESRERTPGTRSIHEYLELLNLFLTRKIEMAEYSTREARLLNEAELDTLMEVTGISLEMGRLANKINAVAGGAAKDRGGDVRFIRPHGEEKEPWQE